MLIDLATPGIDGYDLVCQLRRVEQFTRTPMIAMTGFGDEAHRRKAFDAGFNEVVLKPYPAADLKHLVENFGRRSHWAILGCQAVLLTHFSDWQNLKPGFVVSSRMPSRR